MELKPGYKQTEVGVIPEEWEVVTASEACSLVVDCKNRTPPIVDASEYAVVRTPNVRDGQFIQEDLRFTDESSYREWTARAVPQAGDIMITREAPLGEVCAVPETHKVCLGQRMMLYRPSPSKTDSRYLLYSLMSLPVRANLMRKIGGSTVGHAKVDDIRFLKLPLPPLSEQRTIASLLSDTDALLASLKQLIAKKRDIKQAAMQELLTGKRRLPGFEGEWAQVSLGSVAAMNSGGTPPTGRDDFYGGGIPWVSISDMTSSGRFISETDRTLSDLGLANCSAKRFPSGTILYAMYASLGECSIAAREVTTSQAILGIRPGSSLVGEYLYYWLESIRGAVKLMGQQGTQSNLNKKIVQGFSLGLPSKAEQAAIAKVLSEIDQDIDTLKVKAEKTRAMKAGMLQQLLTGKIRLK